MEFAPDSIDITLAILTTGNINIMDKFHDRGLEEFAATALPSVRASVGGSDAQRLKTLRRRAEAAAKSGPAEPSRGDQALSIDQANRMLHELRTQQIELEMQNEELRHTQAELQAARERHVDFYNLAPLGYCTVTEQGLISEVNLASTRLFNLPRIQLIKRPISRFILKEDQDIYYELGHRIGEAAEPQSCELRLLKRDGAPFWAHMVVCAVRNESGGSDLRMVLKDITERKRAELAMAASVQSLHISEKQMEIVQRISGTGSWTYNLVTDEIWGSAEGMRIFGFPPVAGIFPFDRFEACIAEQDRAQVHQSLQALINEGGNYDLEFTVMPADGSAAKVTHSVGVLETDAQGKPLLVLGFVQDITKTKMMEERVRQLAFLDPLTALPNRRLLLDRMGQALAATQRSAEFGALLYLDLDNFKPLNDQHGHVIGDMLLLEVARRLLNCVRAVDTVSRLGGDEFVVLLVDLATEQTQATEQARKLAEKIRDALAQPYLLPVGDQPEPIEHHCSASIGLVLFFKQHQSVEGILKWADAAMYRAKKEGRNRITFMTERRAQQRL